MTGIISDNQGRSSGLVKAVGGGIEKVSSDPGSPAVGDVWFNTTTNLLKVRGYQATGTFSAEAVYPYWRTVGDMAGNAAAAWSRVGYGNNTSPTSTPNTYHTYTGDYDGTSWSTGGAYALTVGEVCGTGTATAGLSTGGWNSGFITHTGEYDGSSWATTGSLSTGRYDANIGGTQSDAQVNRGRESSGSAGQSTEEYDGSSWSAGGNVGADERTAIGGGAAIASSWTVGGSGETAGFEYDGTSWSSGGDLSAAKTNGGHSNGGATDDRLIVGNDGSKTTDTETYNGTSWSAGPAYGITVGGVEKGTNASTASGALSIGGSLASGYSNYTASYAVPGPTTLTVTTS